MRTGMAGLGGMGMLGDVWDEWYGPENSSPETYYVDPNSSDMQNVQDWEMAFWGGNTVSTASNPIPANTVSPAFLNVMTGNDATPQQAAAAYVQGAAQSGQAVPASVVSSWQAQGIDLSSLLTTAGAAFKLVAGAGGYVPTPTNQQAVAAVQAGQAQSKLLLYGGIAAVALFVLLKH